MKEEIKRYDDLEINLFELPLGCSVKVDLDSVVYPTLDVLKPRLRNQGFEVSSRKDVEIIEAKENFEVHRKFLQTRISSNIFWIVPLLSFDLSSRKKLWQSQSDIVEEMKPVRLNC